MFFQQPSNLNLISTENPTPRLGDLLLGRSQVLPDDFCPGAGGRCQVCKSESNLESNGIQSIAGQVMDISWWNQFLWGKAKKLGESPHKLGAFAKGEPEQFLLMSRRNPVPKKIPVFR